MTNQLRLLLLFLVLSLTTIAQNKVAKASEKGWHPLFAADLSDAAYSKEVWKIEDGGVITATEDKAIWSTKQYQNFILDLEFKTAPGTNSGVLVYCTDTANWIPNSVEIQIADDYSDEWSKAPKTWQCGAIFGRMAANEQKVVKKPGEWNRYIITCKGPNISVELNGKHVTNIDMRKWTSATKNPDGSDIPEWLNKPMAQLATSGYIGLQGKHAGAPIWFRKIRIKEL